MAPQNLAGWWTRAGAQVIDGLILMSGGIALMLVVLGSGVDEDVAIAVLYGVLIVAVVVYNALMLSRKGEGNGQTIGKNAMGIRVVRTDCNGPITLDVASRREALRRALLGISPFYSIIDIFWPISDVANQSLHDKVAKTYVVMADAPVTPQADT